MKKSIFLSLFLIVFFFLKVKAQTTTPTLEKNPKAFISMSVILGRHDVVFKKFNHAAGMSFGFKINAGIYVTNSKRYRGGLQFTLIEGASNNKDRRRLSEEFELIDKDFDKHIIYKFAMFRSSNIGWFSELKLGQEKNNIALFHQVGFGIFGLTENNPLFNFGMHNSLGVITGDFTDNFRLKVGLLHDTMIGTGNPNYGVNNFGFSIGGMKNF
ncbi:hypothetical protein WAF17_13850 [Bernardetia sp. ABR2-2B]|uniref:hypothetical protein n=1 Tax=Bernardetia sp. ABR2-2B TaxID=3127472 RepID=UPI0030CA5CC4